MVGNSPRGEPHSSFAPSPVQTLNVASTMSGPKALRTINGFATTSTPPVTKSRSTVVSPSILIPRRTMARIGLFAAVTTPARS